ncbi:MAG TPA: hypothetical protein PLI65_11330 [Bacteroidales bacterium]|mgnify:FL=1|nr:hypothetical protein [Bacteroidales bacterium]
MNQNNSDHLSDEFLSKLLKQTADEKPSEAFTNRVMASLPVAEPVVETIGDSSVKWWQWVLYVAVVALAGYLLFTFNLLDKMELSGDSSAINPNYYIRLFSSIITLFTEGFSQITFSTKPLIIVLAVVILYFGDRLMKNRLKPGRHEITNYLI